MVSGRWCSTSVGWPCPPPPGNHHPVPHVLEGVERGPHVQDGELVGLWVDLPAVIVVDDVPHLAAAPVHDPVVAVEGELVPGGQRASQRDG